MHTILSGPQAFKTSVCSGFHRKTLPMYVCLRMCERALYGINGIPYNTITRLPYDAPLLDGTVFTTQCLKPAYTGTV